MFVHVCWFVVVHNAYYVYSRVQVRIITCQCMLVYKQISNFTLQRFVYNLSRFNKYLLQDKFGDNTCFKVC